MKKRLLSVFLLLSLLLSVFSVISCYEDDENNSDDPFNSELLGTNDSTDTSSASTNTDTSGASTNTDTSGASTNTDNITEEPSVPSELQAAINNTLSLNAYGVSIDTGLDISAGFFTLHNVLNVDVKVTEADSSKPKMYAAYQLLSIWKNASGELYTDGDWLYVSEETQYKQSLESDYEIDYISLLKSTVSSLPLDMFEGASLEVVENGKRVQIDIPSEVFLTQYEEEIDKLLAFVESAPDIDITSASVAIVINDGFLVTYELSFDFNYALVYEGIQTLGKASVTSITSFAEPSEEIIITPPVGYESFPEAQN